MRQIQLVLLTAIFVVLAVIAFQLHRLSGDLQIGADLRRSLIVDASRPPETPEQHKARIAAEAQRFNRMVNDNVEVFTESMKLDAQKHHSKPKP